MYARFIAILFLINNIYTLLDCIGIKIKLQALSHPKSNTLYIYSEP